MYFLYKNNCNHTFSKLIQESKISEVEDLAMIVLASS